MKILFSSFQLKTILTAAALALSITAWGQDHGHLYISAYSKAAGAQLYFDNGDAFVSTNGYVKTLTLNSNETSRLFGRYDGNITVTPRSISTSRGSEYSLNAAAPGSVMYFQITNVTGPAGGAFEFWESSGNAPAFSIPVGSGATNAIKVSQSSGLPGEDPWGHIHGRRFTATKPGIYLVTIRALDLSTNGPSGSPIHTASAPLTIAFQAGFAMASVTRAGGVATIRFGTSVTHDFTVQANTSVAADTWFNVSGKLRGTDYFQSVQDPAARDGARFYRVLAEPADL